MIKDPHLSGICSSYSTRGVLIALQVSKDTEMKLAMVEDWQATAENMVHDPQEFKA